jgi:hypothetical protein
MRRTSSGSETDWRWKPDVGGGIISADMSIQRKPEHSPRGPTGPEPDLTPEEEEARIQRLIAEGLLLPPEGPDGLLEELLTPGPSCPGLVEALIEDRRSRP